VAFSADGRRLASGSGNGTVKVWDAASGQQTHSLYIGEQEDFVFLMTVAFSPDGRRLAAASLNGGVKVWDAATGREILSKGGPSLSLAFSPDGGCLATAGIWSLQVWDAATGQETLTLLGHSGNGYVYGAAFSHDGQRLASAGGDGTVKVWDTVTGQEILTLHGHTGAVRSVAFSSDGRRLASCSEDGTVKVWEATPLTEELRIQREAMSMVQFLFNQPLPDSVLAASTVGVLGGPEGQGPLRAAFALFVARTEPLSRSQVVAAIRHDQTISEPLRQAALAGAARYAESLTAGHAEKLVGDLFEQLLLRSAVLEQIRKDRSLPEPLRQTSLTLAEHWPEDPDAFNNASWQIVRVPGATAEQYAQALRYAEAACRMEPENGNSLNTLGIAQYRAGRYQEALATLTRSDQIHSKVGKGSQPADLAFLAMAQHHLGQNAQARSTFARLRQVMKDPAVAGNQESVGFQREAEALLQERKTPGPASEQKPGP
jgi:hypothetical protein